jgi:hypothetical protein
LRVERLQEDIMQADIKRGNAAFRIRGVGLSVAILAGATLSLSAPERALAACGGSSRPAGVHAAAAGSGGVHAATGIAAPSGGGGGGGSLGCAGGSSASALRGLPVASSGRVVETGAHAARNQNHARSATTTRTANAGAHMHALGHAHRT